jgi:hypothetical protein
MFQNKSGLDVKTEETFNRLYNIPKKEFKPQISEKMFEIKSSFDKRFPITIQSLQPCRRSFKPRINEIIFQDETDNWSNQEQEGTSWPTQPLNKSIKPRLKEIKKVAENEANLNGEENNFLKNIKSSEANFHRIRNHSLIHNEK